MDIRQHLRESAILAKILDVTSLSQFSQSHRGKEGWGRRKRVRERERQTNYNFQAPEQARKTIQDHCNREEARIQFELNSKPRARKVLRAGPGGIKTTYVLTLLKEKVNCFISLLKEVIYNLE